jgi:hypothetical protein
VFPTLKISCAFTRQGVSLLLLPLPPRSSITLVMADEFWAYDWQADGRYRRYLASAIQKVRDMSTALTVYSAVIG